MYGSLQAQYGRLKVLISKYKLIYSAFPDLHLCNW